MKSIYAALAVIAVLSVSGCGNYYTAEVQGFVVDTQNDAGINGATVRLYLDEPDAPYSPGFFARTSTALSNGQGGYFRNAVVWNAWFGSYGPEGDSGSVYLGVTHEDYASAVIEVPGVLSDHVNTVENIVLSRVSFEAPTVKGRVVDVNGSGVNGVRVVLDLASTTGTTEDYVTTTADEPEGAGYYVFNNVTWRDDANAGSPSDDESAGIIVDDAEWEAASGLTITLTSGQDRAVSTDIPVTRQPRSEFSTTISGRVIHLVGETQFFRAGIDVQVTLQGTNTVRYTQTGVNGQFAVRLEWTDTSPGDFDGDGDIADGAVDPSIPEGEDGLLVDILYDVDGDGYDDGPATPLTGYRVKSWFNPNYVPDWDPGF